MYGSIEPFCFRKIRKNRLTTNFTLILQPPQDSGPAIPLVQDQTTYRSRNQTLFIRFHAFLCAITLILGIPFFAEAGILSLINDVLGSSSASASVSLSPNTQKMELLQAATNSDPIPRKDDTENIIVNGEALTNEHVAISSEEGNDTRPISDQISLYTVRKGDTLQQIAEMYNVTANTILWANDLKRGAPIVAGQVLVILPVSGVKYSVKKGDTIQSIAKQYKVEALNIAEYNNLEENTVLAVGDELIIPDGVFVNEGTQPTNSKASGSGASLSANSQSSKSTSAYFIRPVVGGVRTQGIHGHNGIDIAAALGTPIRAAAQGTVVISRSGGWNGGYGNYVVIQHSNGMQTLYAHMNTVNVSVGETVNKGEQIGTMGTTGKSTGVHLHFEVRGGKNPF